MALKSDGTVVAWGYNNASQITVPPGLSDVIAIASGGYHSLALKSDGTVVAWGDSTNGETTVPAGLSGVAAIAGGTGHSLALKAIASPVGWGDSGFGDVPPPLLTGLKAISAGFYNGLALKNDGTVVGWGTNSFGESSPPAGLTGVVGVAAGWHHGVALKGDGTVVAWGDNTYGQTNVPSGLTGVKSIAAGDYHSLALKSDGTVVVWGNNSSGQLSVPGALNNIKAIAAGERHSLAVKDDGTVVSWGRDDTNRDTPPAGLTGVVAVAGGGFHSLALKNDGAIVAWGDNRFGETIVPTGLTGLIAISGGLFFSQALKSDGTVVAWGQNPAAPAGLTGVVAIASAGSHSLGLTNHTTIPVTITSAPPGLSFSVSGTGCQPGSYSTPQTLPWQPGSSCMVSFGTPQSGPAGTRYLFHDWADDATLTNSRTLMTPASATTYTANFTAQYFLTTCANPSAGGSVSGSAWYDAGTNATVGAAANTGYAFSGFTGALSGATNPQQLVMNAPATVTANFTALPDLAIVKSHSANHFSQGQNGPTYSILVTNSGPGATVGTVTVTDTIPAGLHLVSLAGAGWTCPNNVCWRKDALGPNSGYPAITVTVNVDPAAPATVTNMASVSVTGDYNASNNMTADLAIINRIVDISGRVSVTQNGYGRNRSTGIWSATMTVPNTSAAPIDGPIQLVFTNLTPGVTMTNNTGGRNGSPYLTVSPGALAAGASVNVTIQFSNPNNAMINFTPITGSCVF